MLRPEAASRINGEWSLKELARLPPITLPGLLVTYCFSIGYGGVGIFDYVVLFTKEYPFLRMRGDLDCTRRDTWFKPAK